MPQVEEGHFSTEGSVHLDALRGLAALVVVLGHTRSLYFNSTGAPETRTTETRTTEISSETSVAVPGPAAPVVEPRITIGNEAVMIFFVLSGFLVGGSVLRSFRKNTWSWKDYLAKRLTRLWVVLVPALLLGLIVDHAGIRLFGLLSIYGSPAGQLIVVGDLLQRLKIPVLLGNLFFTQGILVAEFGSNESLWSLAFEFWYYLLFPLLAVIVLGRAKLVPRLFALGIFAGISYFIGTWILAHFPVWMLGAAVAWLPLKLSTRTARRLAAGMAAILILSLPLIRKVPVSIYVAEWVIAILSGCLIYLIKHLDLKRRPDWYAAISGFFSRISYTLYLIHLPLAVFLCALLNRPWHVWTKTGANLSIWVATNVAVVGLAYVFYRLFEANTDAVRKAIMRLANRQKIAL